MPKKIFNWLSEVNGVQYNNKKSLPVVAVSISISIICANVVKRLVRKIVLLSRVAVESVQAVPYHPFAHTHTASQVMSFTMHCLFVGVSGALVLTFRYSHRPLLKQFSVQFFAMT